VRTRVRRSVFDILQEFVAGCAWLDLYAGSGSFGIEALSRGARAASFVEAGAAGLACLRRNLADLGLAPPEAEILRRRLPGALEGAPPRTAPFDIVSLDPPFAVSREPRSLEELCAALARAGERGWFRRGTLLIWEEPAGAPAPVPRGFEESDLREFGTSRVRILEYRPGSAERVGPAQI
jgi:16S rRNA (guanine966-N2)-methyltransferase